MTFKIYLFDSCIFTKTSLGDRVFNFSFCNYFLYYESCSCDVIRIFAYIWARIQMWPVGNSIHSSSLLTPILSGSFAVRMWTFLASPSSLRNLTVPTSSYATVDIVFWALKQRQRKSSLRGTMFWLLVVSLRSFSIIISCLSSLLSYFQLLFPNFCEYSFLYILIYWDSAVLVASLRIIFDSGKMTILNWYLFSSWTILFHSPMYHWALRVPKLIIQFLVLSLYRHHQTTSPIRSNYIIWHPIVWTAYQ